MKPRVLVIVVTFNQWDLTQALLATLSQQTNVGFQVLVIDNASTDATPARVREFAPNAQVIENTVNLGYARGNNVGLEYALQHDFEYALVLNNDVTVAPNCLDELVTTADANADAALLGPLVYHADEPTIIQSAGGILPDDWHSYHRGANEPDTNQFSTVAQVDWLTGCAVLARVSALRNFGLLDEKFFMYGEDVDWGVRARRDGYRVLMVPQAHAWHRGVRRDYSPAPYVTYYSARNELHLMQKHRAGVSPVLRAWVRNARTVASWSVLPRWRGQRAQRDALARAMRDAALRRTGRTV